MDVQSSPAPTMLFTIRLWQEVTEHGNEWRGELKNLASGERRYFRDWVTLAALLPRMLADRNEPITGNDK